MLLTFFYLNKLFPDPGHEGCFEAWGILDWGCYEA
jgi:hypothetical protein